MATKVGLIKGRHTLPMEVTEYIFDGPIPGDYLTDKRWLYENAKNAVLRLGKVSTLEIYVTGLTQALIATFNACRELGIKVVCVHYDRATRGWWWQEVL